MTLRYRHGGQEEPTRRTGTVRSYLRGALTVALLSAVTLMAACSTPADSLPPIPAAAPGEYHLGAGDQVRIITFSDEQLTGEFRVADDGNIALPLLGPVKAAGLTTAQLEGVVAQNLREKNLYKDPSVSVEVIAYRPVFVLGEVNRPGQFPFQPGMTVVTAIAVAGGFTYRAIDDKFTIVRNAEGKSVEGSATRQTPVRPGDVITVYERRF
jgi:polysaccharide export outer membrane protein